MWHMKDNFNGLSYFKELPDFSLWKIWLDELPYLSQSAMSLCGCVKAEK